MIKSQPWITDEKREGIKTLLKFVVGKYKNSTSLVGKRMWKEDIDFLAELQKQQTYSESDKEEYNKIRKKYYLHKEIDREYKLLGNKL